MTCWRGAIAGDEGGLLIDCILQFIFILFNYLNRLRYRHPSVNPLLCEFAVFLVQFDQEIIAPVLECDLSDSTRATEWVEDGIAGAGTRKDAGFDESRRKGSKVSALVRPSADHPHITLITSKQFLSRLGRRISVGCTRLTSVESRSLIAVWIARMQSR